MYRFLVLSGPIAAGKTTLANRLRDQFDFPVFSTRQLIETRIGRTARRTELQDEGERLDRDTGGQWLAEALGIGVSGQSDHAWAVVDAAHTQEQIEGLRAAYPVVVHVHLTAGESTRRRRYLARVDQGLEHATYERVVANETERQVDRLAGSADLVIDTDMIDDPDAMALVIQRLGLET